MSQQNRVILIHGLHQAPFMLRPMAKRLQAQGFNTHQYGYRSMRDDIKTHSARLNQWLAVNHDPEHLINLVAHSLGGLIIRDFVAAYPQWQIGRCVTLGTPHNGSICADYTWRLMPAIVGRSYQQALDGSVAALPEHIDLGVIAGNKPQGLGQPLLSYHNRKLMKARTPLSAEQLAHDGTVYVSETQLINANDHLILPVTHTGMLIHKEVAQQTGHFLIQGRFKR